MNPLSRDSSYKRGRGFSLSNVAGNGPSSRSNRPPSPRANAFQDSPNGFDPTSEPTAHPRPPVAPSHDRQTSSHQNGIYRTQSNTSPHTSSPSSSPNRGPGPYDTIRAVDKPLTLAADGFNGAHIERSSGVSSTLTRVPTWESMSGTTRNNSISAINAQIPARIPGTKPTKDPVFRTMSRRPSHQVGELETVSEFAMEHLYKAFLTQADQKINHCVASAMLQSGPTVEQVCGPGADLGFDQLLSAMGRVVRKSPGALIDKLMVWRASFDKGSRSESRQGASSPYPTTAQGQSSDPAAALDGQNGTSRINPSNAVQVASERRSIVAKYLLCRVLMEILSQSTLANVSSGRLDRLTEIIYASHAKNASPELLDRSPMVRAQWNISSLMLGVLADLDFDNVASRFLADLRAFQKDIGVKNYTNRESEMEAILYLKAMRYIRLKTEPEYWTKSCTFMYAIADLFAGVHGQPPKMAYCRLIGSALLPVAANPSTDFDHPSWKKVYNILHDRLSQLVAKPKYWPTSFPVQAILACVAPSELFASRWQTLISSLQSKIRERNNRASVLKAMCRLVWSYSHRTTDAPTVVSKTLDDIARMAVASGKKYSLSAEPATSEPLIQLVRIIGSRNQDICFRGIIFPLLNAEIFSSNKDLKIDDLDPDRMVIGIRAFLAIIGDLERKERPPFPVSFLDERSEEGPNSPRSPGLAFKSRKTSVMKEERLSKPVDTSEFPTTTKEYYNTFCAVLGKIAMICDNAFGGHTTLDDKISTNTPKTPTVVDWRFRRTAVDDHASTGDERSGFYDLLHVAIQALPRCLSLHTPVSSLVNLLCTGTAHSDCNIATSAVKSLKSIAEQGHAQLVTAKFSSFILTYENRSSSVSDGGLLDPGHVENTLKLYIELLNVWIDEVQDKAGRPAHDEASSDVNGKLDTSTNWILIDRVEAQGLLFLCSPSFKIRTLAIDVLRLITQFDTALGKPNPRIMQILQGDTAQVIDAEDSTLSVKERSRLQRGLRGERSQNALIELCTSAEPLDNSLWNKMFPKLIRLCFAMCPMAVTQTREDVCFRLSQMQPNVEALDDRRVGSRIPSAPVDMIIEQWKFYLVFACITLNKTGGSQQNSAQDSQHSRQDSKSSQKTHESFSTAVDLFSKVIPLLSSDSDLIREAAVTGLGSINVNLYKSLLDCLDNAAREHSEGMARQRAHSRTGSSPARPRHNDHFRTELANVYKLTAHFLQKPEIFNDVTLMRQVTSYTKDLYYLLNNLENQQVENPWEFQRMRIHYCGLVEQTFLGATKTKNSAEWMSFAERKAAFILLEGWCGYSPDEPGRQQGQSNGRTFNRGRNDAETAVRLLERKDLMDASLNAMATLCVSETIEVRTFANTFEKRGPISLEKRGGTPEGFSVDRLLSWVDRLLNDVGDQRHAIGRRALKNIIIYNRQYPHLLIKSIDKLYLATSAKSLEGYLEVVSDVLMKEETSSVPLWKLISALLFTLGHKGHNIRMKSARLLRFYEESQGQGKSSKLHDLDISVSDNTTAVNKLAQFEISQRLSLQHPEIAFYVFSEVSRFFTKLDPDDQRNMVGAILPWIQTMELQLDPKGGPTAASYMLLMNLLEITIKCSQTLHHEIAALWKALATGPHGGNVQLVLDFIIALSLDKKDQNLIPYAKQIVVHLSSTQAGHKVIEFLLLQISPKTMVQENRPPVMPPVETKSLPYLADLSHFLPEGLKQSGISLGHLCLILLVDLIVSPVELNSEHVPQLLQVVLVLWDYHMEIVREQAREMLVHLIHELVVSKIDMETLQTTKMPEVEDLIELVRRNDASVVWVYDEYSSKDSGYALPPSMTYVVDQVKTLFSLTYPTIHAAWGKTTMNWATSCPVRHLACRSLQIYRCLLRPLDQTVLSDLLPRLSGTIADEDPDIQAYATEIVRTFRAIVEAQSGPDIKMLPQLFWTMVACLDSVHEWEFAEAITILEVFLNKYDFQNPKVLALITEAKPEKWQGMPDGIFQLILRGCRSGNCLDKSLEIINRLISLRTDPIIGNDSRLLFALLANLPSLLRSFEKGVDHVKASSVATTLAQVSRSQGNLNLADVLEQFAGRQYTDSVEFLTHSLRAVGQRFFPKLELESLKFVMGILTNNISWFRSEALNVLRVIVGEIDMSKPEIAEQGTDLVSPLLRLLQTEFCPQALQVLDQMTAMAGTPMDGQHLRMSMAGVRSNRTVRKEYDGTISHYGIPHESGWSVAIPARRKDITRTNIGEIFNAFCDSLSMNTTGLPTPEVEFAKEDYGNDSYFPGGSQRTLSNDTTIAETNMGELVSKLDDLDDFFDNVDIETQSPHSLASTPNSSFRGSPYPGRHSPKASMHRNASQHSSRSGFYDPRQQVASRDPVVMSPSAFTASSRPPPSRPGMPSRSVTSPAVNQHTPPDSSFLVQHDNIEPFSDDDLSAGRTSIGDRPNANENTFRPLSRGKGSFRNNVRSGLKKLTGTARTTTQDSPEVPKVPEQFLNYSRSGEA